MFAPLAATMSVAFAPRRVNCGCGLAVIVQTLTTAAALLVMPGVGSHGLKTPAQYVVVVAGETLMVWALPLGTGLDWSPSAPAYHWYVIGSVPCPVTLNVA